MAGFLFAFLAVLVAGLGARDQILLAQLTRVQGPRAGILVVACLAATATSAFVGWAGAALMPQMSASARVVFAAIALVLAGGEMLLLAPGKAPAEPTRSLFAGFMVLAAQQVTDAARFLILALGVATALPVQAAMGGAVASMAGLTAAWIAPEWPAHGAVRVARRLAGALLLIGGLALGLPRVIG